MSTQVTLNSCYCLLLLCSFLPGCACRYLHWLTYCHVLWKLNDDDDDDEVKIVQCTICTRVFFPGANSAL